MALYGTQYVRLDDWARSRDFQVRWLVAKEQAKLSGAGSTVIVNVDSAKATINGINVWLAAPVAFRQGQLYISPVDVTKVLNPLIWPSKSSAAKPIRTICLDPGHGGRDMGHGANGHTEKYYTMLLAKELKEQLGKAGFKVVMTRNSDSYVELDERPDAARLRKADLFLSLHFNSAGRGNSSVKGSEIYCMTPAFTSSTNARGEGGQTRAYPGNKFDSKNVLLAYEIQKAMVKQLRTEDRGVKHARFAVLRTAEMPAVLIEGGFLTNPSEAKKIATPAYRKQMAQAITSGILNYRKALERDQELAAK